ncbi:MAG: helix-hairpin-helix domain-containing protein [Phycisphaerales bacterium]|nr:helix-hairpin-helix domain-containing protein [Phycisphaerales bacterium]
MISRIEGELVSITEGGCALLRCDHITYELLVPGADQQRLGAMLGQPVSFHTLYYLESQGQGAVYVPRLIGFNSPDDRAFFELFTTVKGIGARKALRALQLPFGTIASAIAARDLDLLISLPEIGKRTAETIVAELHGKVDRFIEIKPISSADGGISLDGKRAALIRDAVSVLAQLGEPKLYARQLIDRALAADPTLDSPEILVAAAFRLKELG